MIVFTHPTDTGYVDSFNDWYTDNHMIDVATSPPYRSASRYILERRVAGTPLPYLAIYEIAAPYSEQVHQEMMQQVGVDPWPLREPMPVTDGGQGADDRLLGLLPARLAEQLTGNPSRSALRAGFPPDATLREAKRRRSRPGAARRSGHRDV